MRVVVEEGGFSLLVHVIMLLANIVSMRKQQVTKKSGLQCPSNLCKEIRILKGKSAFVHCFSFFLLFARASIEIIFVCKTCHR